MHQCRTHLAATVDSTLPCVPEALSHILIIHVAAAHHHTVRALRKVGVLDASARMGMRVNTGTNTESDADD